jgi:hypothetical protein
MAITCLESALGPLFHLYSPVFIVPHSKHSHGLTVFKKSLNDTEVLTLAVCMPCYSFLLSVFLSSFTVVMVLMHAVHDQVLSNRFTTVSAWISAISPILLNRHDIVQDKVCTIGAEVAMIVGEIEDRNIVTQWKIVSKWKFSSKEAETFAGKLHNCVQHNLM